MVTTAFALAVAAGASIAFSWLIRRQVPWRLIDSQTSLQDIIKLAFAVVAGLGGVVALVVAYRRQRFSENDDSSQRERARLLNERYVSAVELLGASTATVRLAGAYALARLADDWPEQRQVCIDVLCAYLRLPANDVDARELEVRRSIVLEIRDHLQQPESPTSWCTNDFDFSGATFFGGSFDRAHFRGTKLYFGDCTFSNSPESVQAAKTSFRNVEFASNRTSFKRAKFIDATVRFDGSAFASKETIFDEMSLIRSDVSLKKARFIGKSVEARGVKVEEGSQLDATDSELSAAVQSIVSVHCSSDARFASGAFSSSSPKP